MYFPSIGTLRSRYIPESHRSVIINIFGIPLNLIVVAVFLSIKQLGVSGVCTRVWCACVCACVRARARARVLFLSIK